MWSAESEGLDGTSAAIGTVPPTSIAAAGDLWWNESEDSGRLFIYTGDEWVDASPVGVLQEVADAIYLSKTQDDTTSGQLTATGGFVGDLTGIASQVAVEQSTSETASKPILCGSGTNNTDTSKSVQVPSSSNYPRIVGSSGLLKAPGGLEGSLTGTASDCSRTVTAGDGLSGGGALTDNVTVAVDSTVVRTSGNQTIADTKTFSNDVTINGTLSVRTAVDLADNDVVRFGSGDDVEFFFNGSHMYTDLNAGDWYIRDGTATKYVLQDDGSLLAYGTASQMNSGFSVARGIGSDQKIYFTCTSGGNNINAAGGSKDLKFFNLNSGYSHRFYTAFSTSSSEQKERFKIDGSNVYVLDQTGDATVC